MKTLLTSIRRTPYQSFAIYLSLFLTLFLSAVLIFCIQFLYGLLGYVESRPQVTIYFQSQVTESDILKVKKDLLDTGKVNSIKYISKNDAYTLYKDANKDNPLLLEMVTPDILPASLEIYAKKPSYLPEIANLLNSIVGKDEVNFQKNVVEKLLSITNIVRIISLCFFVFLMSTTIVIVITITHFKVALKRDEIELLRLLGAPTGYIRKPFIQESLILAFFASITVSLLFGIFLFILSPVAQSYLQGIQSLIIDMNGWKLTVWPISTLYAFGLFISLTLYGLFIVFIATFIATHKYLTVKRT